MIGEGDWTPLVCAVETAGDEGAARRDVVAVVDVLADAGADLLLGHGADPTPTVGRRSWTPAAVARELGHDEVADALDAATG